jgi:hypothetical protein
MFILTNASIINPTDERVKDLCNKGYSIIGKLDRPLHAALKKLFKHMTISNDRSRAVLANDNALFLLDLVTQQSIALKEISIEQMAQSKIDEILSAHAPYHEWPDNFQAIDFNRQGHSLGIYYSDRYSERQEQGIEFIRLHKESEKTLDHLFRLIGVCKECTKQCDQARE